MYKIVHGNVRFPGSWRGLLDGPRADRMPQRDAHLPCLFMLHDLVSRVQKALAVPAFAQMRAIKRAPKGPVPWIHDRIDAASLDLRRVRRRPFKSRDTGSDEAGPVVRHLRRVPEAQCRIRPWSECPVVS